MTQAMRPQLIGLPVLETERLVLRAPMATDWPAFLSFRHSARTAFVGGTKNAHQAAEQFAGFLGHWMDAGSVYRFATAGAA